MDIKEIPVGDDWKEHLPPTDYTETFFGKYIDPIINFYNKNIRWPFVVAFYFPWQRATRGFDDTALWSVDEYLIDHIEKVLITFRFSKMWGYPARFGKDGVDGNKEWRDKLSELHRRWEKLSLLKKNESVLFSVKDYQKERDYYNEAKHEAFSMLEEMFDDLWD